MARPREIELPTGETIPILFEDRSILAIDKPAGWMLVPFSWQRTNWNLQAALVSSISSGAFWARSRQIRFLRYVHRLDAETTGVLLFGRSPGAVDTFGRLFEGRRMRKVYLAAVEGVPGRQGWTSRGSIAPDAQRRGCMRIDRQHGKEALTDFQVVQTVGKRTLVVARPLTGRTHQIRVHLREEGLPIVGDLPYGTDSARPEEGFGLRAIELGYRDPFTGKEVRIRAPVEEFLAQFGFDAGRWTAGPGTTI